MVRVWDKDAIAKIDKGNKVLAEMSFSGVAEDAVKYAELNSGSISPKTLLSEYSASKTVSSRGDLHEAFNGYQQNIYEKHLSEFEARRSMLDIVQESTQTVIDQAKKIGSHLGKVLAAQEPTTPKEPEIVELDNLSGLKPEQPKPTGRGGRQ